MILYIELKLRQYWCHFLYYIIKVEKVHARGLIGRCPCEQINVVIKLGFGNGIFKSTRPALSGFSWSFLSMHLLTSCSRR